MFSSSKLYNKRVFVTNSKGVQKSYGKIRSVVFHPSDLKAVGVIIKRPDLALMVKRKDRFAAFDRMEIRSEGPIIFDQEDTWDTPACRRLGVRYEKCVLWDYMPVKTTIGRELGTVSNVYFDEGTFQIERIDISSGGASRKLLGEANIDAADIIGYSDGAIIVEETVGAVSEAGGMAATAGEAWAGAKHKATQAGRQVGERAGQAADAGAYNLGKAIGTVKSAADETVRSARAQAAADRGEAPQEASRVRYDDGAASRVGRQLGRASHMFQDFKDEFDKASHGE